MKPILTSDEIRALMADISLLEEEGVSPEERTGASLPKPVILPLTPVASGAMMTDPDGTILWVSEDLARLKGEPVEKLLGQTAEIMKDPSVMNEIGDTLRETLLNGKIFNAIVSEQKNGRLVKNEVTLIPVMDETGVLASCIHVWKEVTQKLQEEKAIWRQAHIDSLTGLPNRNVLFEWMPVEVERSKRENSRLAVLFLDLNDFKKVNDTCGHEGGDLLLKIVSGRLRRAVRKTDLVVRLGGDEFIILLKDVNDGAVLSNLIERIMDSISRPVLIEGRTITVSGSAGVALCPDDGMDWKNLIEQSDCAMYQAKGLKDERWCLVSSLAIVKPLLSGQSGSQAESRKNAFQTRASERRPVSRLFRTA